MATQEMIDLYRSVRGQPEIWAELSAQPDEESWAAKVSELATERGVDLSLDQIHSALPDLPDIVSRATDGDELTDDELELIVAGFPIMCDHGSNDGIPQNGYTDCTE